MTTDVPREIIEADLIRIESKLRSALSRFGGLINTPSGRSVHIIGIDAERLLGCECRLIGRRPTGNPYLIYVTKAEPDGDGWLLQDRSGQEYRLGPAPPPRSWMRLEKGRKGGW